VRIAIIGGGAAGFLGAITAARSNSQAEVSLLEATQHPLDKVRISGGGRCNVTHHCFDPSELIKSYPRGGRELQGPYNQFGPAEIIEWFGKEGVKLKTEEDGRMFPVTDKSETITNCLINAAQSSGVNVRLGSRVKSIKLQNGTSSAPQFEIELSGGQKELFDSVLIATGNSPEGYRFAESTGHAVLPRVPSLFTFKVEDERIVGLSGVSFENVKLTLLVGNDIELKQTGPMLITHWGLSGPAVLKLSAWGAGPLHEYKYQAQLTVNFLPDYSAEGLTETINSSKQESPKKLVQSANALPIPARYWKQIVKACGIDDETTWGNTSRKNMLSIISELTRANFQIKGKGIFKEEFVTCGGVSLKEVDFKTMQSKRCPGLYFAGEVLDIDGITGGFNFQSAWTTGWIAGSSISPSNGQSGLLPPTK